MSPAAATATTPTRLLTVEDAIVAEVVLREVDADRPGFARMLAAMGRLDDLGRPELEALCAAFPAIA